MHTFSSPVILRVEGYSTSSQELEYRQLNIIVLSISIHARKSQLVGICKLQQVIHQSFYLVFNHGINKRQGKLILCGKSGCNLEGQQGKISGASCGYFSACFNMCSVAVPQAETVVVTSICLLWHLRFVPFHLCHFGQLVSPLHAPVFLFENGMVPAF